MMLTRCGQTGMLGSVETIDVLSDMIEKHNLTAVVVDPVRPRPIFTRLYLHKLLRAVFFC